LAVVGVLALALSNGGDDNVTLVSGSALADAASATERVAGASATVDGIVTAAGLPRPLHFRLQGIQDTRQRAARLVGVYENVPNRGNLPIDSITIIPDIYMKSPIFGGAVPSGKWLHIDIAKTGKELGIGDPTQFGSGDPSQIVQNLRALSSRVEDLGSEDVRGVATRHYRGKVELRRLPAVTPPPRRAAAKRSADRLIQLIGSDSYPLEVWVDRRHLVRRARLKMTMNIQGRSLTQELTTELFDFGPKRKIKPPPAGDTVDAPSVSGSAAGP
jgi:hypothetical protein